MKQAIRDDSSSKTPPFLTAIPGGGAGRVNWLSAFVGLAVGLVVASVAWVQILPSTVSTGGNQDGELLYLGPEGGEVPEGYAVGPGGRIVRRSGAGGSGGTAGSAGTAGRAGQSGKGGAGTSGGATTGGGGSVAGVPPGSVTSSVIKLGATVAEDGIAKAFLGEVRYGMEAVRVGVNGKGGIHGRQLQIIYKNDAWDPSRGQTFITNLIKEDKVFAFAVSPSSEGLNAASNAGLFAQYKVPVVGADGLNNSQFISLQTGAANPWIWPVASATTTQVHVILKDACNRFGGGNCANLRPAIVFGNTYRFGVEGAFAFNGAYCRSTGGSFSSSGQCSGGQNVPGFEAGGTSCKQGSRFCGIDATKQQFPQEIATVNDACKNASIGGGTCNFVLLLLEPATALAWMSGYNPAGLELAGAQPLFTSNFAVQCGIKCNGMRVWTGYNPPIGAYANNQAVADFVRDLQAQKADADERNQFTMGGYIGMKLLVAALDAVGKDLTTDKLVATLNSMAPLVTGLTKSDGLKWTAQGRYANRWAQSFSIDYTDRFSGFKPATAYTADPWAGQDNRLP